MRLVVTLEHRFERTPDGAVWTQAQLLYPFWTPYLSVFDEVRPVARIRAVAVPSPGWQRADGPRVSFVAVPYYVGPWQYLRCAARVRRAARSAVGPTDAVLLRGGSPISDAVEAPLRRRGRPFGLEVLGDPHEALAPGAVRHPLRPVFRWWFTRELRRQCRYACASAYVTERALQARYPCAGYTAHFSDVQLDPSALVAKARSYAPAPCPFTLLGVGSMEQRYKGFHLLLDAVAACRRDGLDLRLILVGDGKHRAELEAQAAAQGIGQCVDFLGQLTAGAPVRQQLDRADLFVLPSYTEGLPRALIEAMARALPCLASDVGGIPELLPAEDLVPPGDRASLARALRAVVSDPDRLGQMSARNLHKARGYQVDQLRERQLRFYRHLHAETRAWLEKHHG